MRRRSQPWLYDGGVTATLQREAEPHERHGARAKLVATDPRALLAGLIASAGLIHVAATFQHINEAWTLPLAYALTAAGQLLAAWLIVRRPDDRRVLEAGAVLCAAVAFVWIFTRTTGVPLGPGGGEVEAPGVGDTIATVQEVAFAGIAVALLRRPHRRWAWLASPVGVRLAYAVLSATMLVGALGGHEH